MVYNKPEMGKENGIDNQPQDLTPKIETNSGSNKYSGPIGRIRFVAAYAWRVATLVVQDVRCGYGS